MCHSFCLPSLESYLFEFHGLKSACVDSWRANKHKHLYITGGHTNKRLIGGKSMLAFRLSSYLKSTWRHRQIDNSYFFFFRERQISITTSKKKTMHSSCSRRTEQSFSHHLHSYSCASLRIRWIEVKVSIHFRRQNSVSKCSKQSGLSRIQYRVEYFGRTWISLPALAHSGPKPQTHERKISRDSVSNAQIVFSNICLDTFCLGNIFVDKFLNCCRR